MTGWIEFRVKGQPGDKAELNCFEVLDADGNVYLDNLRTAKATVTYICGDGEEHIFHENFSFQGFQYAKIASWPESRNGRLHSLCASFRHGAGREF